VPRTPSHANENAPPGTQRGLEVHEPTYQKSGGGPNSRKHRIEIQVKVLVVRGLSGRQGRTGGWRVPKAITRQARFADLAVPSLLRAARNRHASF